MSYPLTLNGNVYVAADFTERGYNRKLGEFLFDLKVEMERSNTHQSVSSIAPEDVTTSVTFAMDYEVNIPIGAPVIAVGFTSNNGMSFVVYGRVAAIGEDSVQLDVLGTYIFPYADASVPIIDWRFSLNSMVVTTAEPEPEDRNELLGFDSAYQREFAEDFIGYYPTARAGAYTPDNPDSDNSPTQFHRAQFEFARPMPGGWPLAVGCYSDGEISQIGSVEQASGPNHHPGVAVLSGAKFQSTAVMALFGHDGSNGVLRVGFRIKRPTEDSPDSLVSIGYMAHSIDDPDSESGIAAFLPSLTLSHNKPKYGPSLKLLCKRKSRNPVVFFTSDYRDNDSVPLGLQLEYDTWYTAHLSEHPGLPPLAVLSLYLEGNLIFTTNINSLPDTGVTFSGRFTPHVCHQVVSAGARPAEVYVDFFEHLGATGY